MSLFAEDDNDHDVLPDTFGGRIVRARETARLSTAQLARRAGVLTKTMQETLGQLRSSLLTVVSGLERIEKRLEQYESYR